MLEITQRHGQMILKNSLVKPSLLMSNASNSGEATTTITYVKEISIENLEILRWILIILLIILDFVTLMDSLVTSSVSLDVLLFASLQITLTVSRIGRYWE